MVPGPAPWSWHTDRTADRWFPPTPRDRHAPMTHAPTVDLYLYASHEIPTWLPIVEALRRRGADARFVLEPPRRNLARGSAPDPHRNWHDDKATNLTALVDQATHARLLATLADAGEEPLRRRRQHADAAITSAGSGWLRAWTGARIRCMYGVGLVIDAWGHGSVNAGFDLVLAPGDFSSREIERSSPTTPVAVVGYPKWAAYRRGEIDRAEARARAGIGASSRSVVLWLPTWAGHSSLDRYQAAFSALSMDHTVVIKPHHNSVRFEQDRLDHLEAASGIAVLPTSADLRMLAAAADVIVSDVRSGGLTEGLLADRPVVALTVGSLTPDRLHPKGSDAVVRCDEPAGLADAVQRALHDHRQSARQQLAEDLFGPSTGDDDDRAADAILQAVDRVGHPRLRRLTAPAWSGAYRAARAVGR